GSDGRRIEHRMVLADARCRVAGRDRPRHRTGRSGRGDRPGGERPQSERRDALLHAVPRSDEGGGPAHGRPRGGRGGHEPNVHRAIYELGEEATREYEGAREKVAAFIQAKSPSEIAFTKSTTESINLVAYGYGVKGKIQKGDEIVGTVMEHHSNHVPWHFVK